MITSKKIGVLGAGIMGKVLIEALAGLVNPKKFLIVDLNRSKFNDLKKKIKGAIYATDLSVLRSADLLFLAVKPQDFFKIDFSFLKKDCLVVSIMAGVSLKSLKRRCLSKKIIRSMPNMLARIKQGFIVWTATPAVSRSEKEFINKLWNILGEQFYTSNETMINQATAVSGSGPAYVFYVFNCFAKAARQLGISPAVSRRMVFKVFSGALEMLKYKQSPELLIKQVASKGGTTAAALKVFDRQQVFKIWQAAVKAAYSRARQLNK